MVEPNPGDFDRCPERAVLGLVILSLRWLEAAEGCRSSPANGRRIDAVLLDAHGKLIHTLSRPCTASIVGCPSILTFQRGRPVSGQTDVDETQPGVATADFLEKPFAPDRLLKTIDRELAVLDGQGLSRDRRRRLGPQPASDTLVSIRTTHIPIRESPATTTFVDTDQTDIFPFAHLLEYGKAAPPPSGNRGAGPRATRALWIVWWSSCARSWRSEGVTRRGGAFVGVRSRLRRRTRKLERAGD